MLKHLASGGMADVMLGRSDGIEGFERHVVLKRIRPDLARDQRFIRMFLDEARVAATLHHQHIVQVHDIGQAAGEYFIAMEYVHGEDVRKILSSVSRQRTHVPLGHAVAIVSAAAAGLHYAHERLGSDKQPLNIVHRDVSPSNILVGYDGAIKVVDFGIATASMRQETRSGSLKGKLSYMSPEQCKGATVDRRSDVYALGVVLYELATTTRMIKGENDYLVMEQIVTGRIPSPQSRRPSLPTELSDIIMRAIATDRDRRYATADDLRIALDLFASTAGLNAPTSAIAAFMRQQFGQRPEPWLELNTQATEVLDEGPSSLDESVPSNSWSESPRSGDLRTSGSILRHSGPIGSISNDAATDAGLQISEPHRPIHTPVPSSTIPTHSRLGWESQHRTSMLSGFPVQKVAIAGGALIAGVAIWLIASGTSNTARSAAALPAPPVATPPPAAAPPPPAAAAPTPSLPPVTEVVATGMIGSKPAATAHEPEPPPPPRKQRAAPSAVAARTATRTIETPAPAKPERPTRVVAVTGPAAAHGDAGVTEPELHRPEAPPIPPPPAPPQPETPTVVAAVQAPAAGPTAPQVVAPTALDANRISGERTIAPDATTMDTIARSGQSKLMSSYKVCVAADGSISSVIQLRGTGFAAYDEKIQSTIRKDWRYRPFLVAGKATPVCTAFKFIYSQK